VHALRRSQQPEDGLVRAAVRRAWLRFSEPFEGRVLWMYKDGLGRIATGVGNDLTIGKAPNFAPSPETFSLPWMHPDGRPATRAEILEAWSTVRAKANGLAGGGTHGGLTHIRLTNAALEAIIERKLIGNETILRQRWPGWDGWPADAQLALLSWAWGVGPTEAYPRMSAALARGDFAAAAKEVDLKSRMPDGTMKAIRTQPARNAANRLLLRNAAVVVADGLNLAQLYWPRELGAPPPAA
jgi:GH24 family phage-related lysozyme (muramidase)